MTKNWSNLPLKLDKINRDDDYMIAVMIEEENGRRSGSKFDIANKFKDVAENFNKWSKQISRVHLEQNPSCPKVMGDPNCKFDIGEEECSEDIDCEGGANCCFDGCKYICFEPDVFLGAPKRPSRGRGKQHGPPGSRGLKKFEPHNVIIEEDEHEAEEEEPEKVDDHPDQECPRIMARSSCSDTSPTCWNGGQRDKDCPNNGLCCFDGCRNMCFNLVHQDEEEPDYIISSPGDTTGPSSTGGAPNPPKLDYDLTPMPPPASHSPPPSMTTYGTDDNGKPVIHITNTFHIPASPINSDLTGTVSGVGTDRVGASGGVLLRPIMNSGGGMIVRPVVTNNGANAVNRYPYYVAKTSHKLQYFESPYESSQHPQSSLRIPSVSSDKSGAVTTHFLLDNHESSSSGACPIVSPSQREDNTELIIKNDWQGIFNHQFIN